MLEMGLFSFLNFFKKKEGGEGKESSDSDDDSDESEAAPSMEDANLAGKIGLLEADIEKIKGQLESFAETRKATQERFSTMNEQLGELRGMVMDTNRAVGTIEVKATKAADLVESVHPDKLMIQVQKEDGKIEGVRASLEANEEMMKNLMSQIKGMRSQMAVFRGLEEVLKLNEEVKGEIMNVKKINAMVEGHADKVETVFSEMQKSFKEFGEFTAQLDTLKNEQKEQREKIEKSEIKFETFLKKKDFEKRIQAVENSDKKAKKLTDELKKEKNKLLSDLDNRLFKLELVSDAFQNLIETNPVFANGLNMNDYISKQAAEQATKKGGNKESKDADKDSGAKDTEGADKEADSEEKEEVESAKKEAEEQNKEEGKEEEKKE